MDYFTSDTHFGHANIIKYSKRPFRDVFEMDRVLIENWNNTVSKEDTIYHLGDFCFGRPDDYLNALNGKIVFVKGSHDKWMNDENKYPLLREIKLSEIYNDIDYPEYNKVLVLCHYPMRSWAMSHYASWHLYGHHHGSLEGYGLSFDIGVDCHDFKPVSLNDISKKMKSLKPIVDFRTP